MATCPDCGQYLADDHVCSGERRRRRRRTDAASAGVGGVLGAALPFLWPGYHVGALAVAITTALGITIAVALARALPR
jgi:hypothetical protein